MADDRENGRTEKKSGRASIEGGDTVRDDRRVSQKPYVRFLTEDELDKVDRKYRELKEDGDVGDIGNLTEPTKIQQKSFPLRIAGICLAMIVGMFFYAVGDQWSDLQGGQKVQEIGEIQSDD